jgi:hypothetical protein
MRLANFSHQQSLGFPAHRVNSIHKPPASIRFAPIKHALAVTVEPFKFSSRQGGVAYELSQRRQGFANLKNPAKKLQVHVR